MKCLILLNAKAGALQQADGDDIVRRIENAFRTAGYDVDCRLVDPADIDAHMDEAADRDDLDLVVAGGGDGTLSGFVSRFAGRETPIACLPLGTMNLFCRSIGIPTDLDQACRALTAGEVRAVDLGDVNGRPFLYHVSIGIMVMTVVERHRKDYRGRLGKMWASLMAFLRCLKRPPSITVSLSTGAGIETFRTAALSIIANPFREEMLGIQRDIDRGALGLYALTSSRWFALVRAAIKTFLLPRVRDAGMVVRETPRLTLHHRRRPESPFKANVDGEIVEIDSPIKATCRPAAVRMLLPTETTAEKAVA